MGKRVKQLEEIYSPEFVEHLRNIAMEHYNNVANFKKLNVDLFEGYRGSSTTEVSFDLAIKEMADDYETAAANFTEVESYHEWLSAVCNYRKAQHTNGRVFYEMWNILNNAGAFNLMHEDFWDEED